MFCLFVLFIRLILKSVIFFPHFLYLFFVVWFIFQKHCIFYQNVSSWFISLQISVNFSKKTAHTLLLMKAKNILEHSQNVTSLVKPMHIFMTRNKTFISCLMFPTFNAVWLCYYTYISPLPQSVCYQLEEVPLRVFP